MNRARYINTNRPFLAKEFEQLPETEIAAYRSSLVCLTCNQPAYFTKASALKGAYFSAHHTPNCGEASVQFSGVDKEIESASKIILKFGTKLDSFPEQTTQQAIHTKKRIRISIEGESTSNRTATRSVDALFDALLAFPDLACSRKHIVVDGLEISASDFFVPFEELGDQHKDRWVGCWGEVFSGVPGKGGWTWLNRDYYCSASVGIPSAMHEEAMTRFSFQYPHELTHAKFLVVGKFNSNLRCMISDLDHLSIHR